MRSCCPWQGEGSPWLPAGSAGGQQVNPRLRAGRKKGEKRKRVGQAVAKVEKLRFKHFLGNCKTSKQFNGLTSPFSGISKTELSSSLFSNAQAPSHPSIRDHFLMQQSILLVQRGQSAADAISKPPPRPGGAFGGGRAFLCPCLLVGSTEGERESCLWWGHRSPTLDLPLPGAELSSCTWGTNRQKYRKWEHWREK